MYLLKFYCAILKFLLDIKPTSFQEDRHVIFRVGETFGLEMDEARSWGGLTFSYVEQRSGRSVLKKRPPATAHELADLSCISSISK